MPTVLLFIMVRHEYPYPSLSSKRTWYSLGQVNPSSTLALIVMFILLYLSLGFENNRILFVFPSTTISVLIRLAMQTDSGSAEFEEGWTVHDVPRSDVTATALPFVAPLSLPFWLSRIFFLLLPLVL